MWASRGIRRHCRFGLSRLRGRPPGGGLPSRPSVSCPRLMRRRHLYRTKQRSYHVNDGGLELVDASAPRSDAIRTDRGDACRGGAERGRPVEPHRPPSIEMGVVQRDTRNRGRHRRPRGDSRAARDRIRSRRNSTSNDPCRCSPRGPRCRLRSCYEASTWQRSYGRHRSPNCPDDACLNPVVRTTCRSARPRISRSLTVDASSVSRPSTRRATALRPLSDTARFDRGCDEREPAA